MYNFATILFCKFNFTKFNSASGFQLIGCNLEKLEKSPEEFIDVFCSQLSSLVWHDYIAKQQGTFLNCTKENLKDSEFAVTYEFSEYYSIVLQDAAQNCL